MRLYDYERFRARSAPDFLGEMWMFHSFIEKGTCESKTCAHLPESNPTGEKSWQEKAGKGLNRVGMNHGGRGGWIGSGAI